MNKINKLEQEILKHKALYYQGCPEISDSEYDKLEDQLKNLSPNSPVLQLVGSEVKGKKKVPHASKMLSLNKTYKESELIRWKGEEEVLSTFKIDGSSCSLIYENGTLTLAKTRGDGSFGEDITDKVNWIPNVPKTIELQSCEVRGEIFCREDSFIHLASEMEKMGLDRPSSQRNIVAGLLGRKENLILCRHLEFCAFELLSEDSKAKTEKEKLLELEHNQFEIPPFEVHKKEKTIKDFLEKTQDFIANGDYLIDGIVFSYNNLKLHRELGATAHHPRYKMAFKFQGVTKNTKIESITWQVSRNGVLTPVAEVEPVELSGAKISRVTLHNYGIVKNFNLKAGDEIEIVRSGEVIPKFLSVVVPGDNEFLIPDKCPSCDARVKIDDIRLVCDNLTCPQQQKEAILYFIQKIGIDDLSSKRLEEMIFKGLVREIPDLYDLTIEKLLTLDKTKEKLAQKIYENIQASKDADLITFLGALGIVGGAYNKCEKIVRSGFNTIESILNLTQAQLESVDSFAEKSASEFLKSLDSKKMLIKNLLKKGFEFSTKEVQESAITGKRFVITGTLSRKRSDIERAIKENGGEAIRAVSAKTDYLVTNDPNSNSSKAKKARELNIPIISEDKLFEMIQA